jgi:hypothetical protein
LLAARETVGIVVALVGEPEPPEQLDRIGLRVGARPAEHLPRRQRDVAEDGHVREEVEGLEDDPDSPPDLVGVDARRRHVSPLDDDPPLVDRLEEVDAAEQRRLP